MTSSDYERLVHDVILELTRDSKALGYPLIAGGRQNKIPGASGFKHQIDVSLKTDQKLLLLECKYWKKAVDVEPVLVLASRLTDIRAANPDLQVSAGIVSTKSPTSGAKRLAKNFDVQLDEVSTPKAYILRIHERFFLRRTDSLTLGLEEHATIVKRDVL